MKEFNWSKPQRQPVAGLAVVFVKTVFTMLKQFWPLIVLLIFKGSNEKPDQNNWLEWVLPGFLLLSLVWAVIKFWFFQFYIDDKNLVVKSGLIKKQTQVIPLQKIQTVNIDQGPVHQLLNIVKLSIDTAGSSKTELTIDALNKTMATALRQQLLSQKENAPEEEQPSTAAQLPLIQLHTKDLLKLSLSANHIEAFFILLSVAIGLWDNLQQINQNIFADMADLLPGLQIYPIVFLTISILIITIIFSTAKIFFRYYNFRVVPTGSGLHMQSGLTHIKERIVGFKKIQYTSWRASWLRKLLGIWLFEYHVAGSNADRKDNRKIEIPITQQQFIAPLLHNYYTLPNITSENGIRIHPSYIGRKFLVLGFIPAIIIFLALWFFAGVVAWWAVLLPVLVGVLSGSTQKKFRLWALNDVAFVKRGQLGEERILLQWQKLQSVRINQSIFQRKKNLATVHIYTAGGTVVFPFIPVEAAHEICNYALYKTETATQGWM